MEIICSSNPGVYYWGYGLAAMMMWATIMWATMVRATVAHGQTWQVLFAVSPGFRHALTVAVSLCRRLGI